MKNRFLIVLASLCLCLPGFQGFAADTTNLPAAVADVNALIGRINLKIQSGKPGKADFADNLQEFDAILARHKGEDPSALSQVLAAKADFYIKVLNDYDKAVQTVIQIQHDYPGTEIAKNSESVLPKLQEMAANAAATRTNVIGGLNELMDRINAKIKAGKNTEADFADNLKEFDALIVKHRGEDPAALAHVLAMKAEMYQEVLQEYDEALRTIIQIQHDFPGTQIAKNCETAIPELQKMAEAGKIQRALAVQTIFPPFSETGLDGKPLSTADYKGKVVLIDFWATWCPPCRAELPNVVKTFQKYHDKGFEVIGISLDKADDKTGVANFTKENNMPWPEYYDGQYWTNKLVLKYGVMAIPMTYLLDGEGRILAKNVAGEELDAAVAKALGVN